ncbi:MAG: SDR family oxidoreductase [bacterium]
MDPKLAVITGASGGIGYELAIQFAKNGYDLVLIARRQKILEQFAHELQQQYKIRVFPITLDLTIPESIETLYQQLKNLNQPVDVLINNAGFGYFSFFPESNINKTMQMLQLNITSLTHLTRLVSKDMLDRNSGKIMNVASTAAFQPGPLMAVYYASKAYVLSFSQALDQELKDTNIHVSALCPGATATGFQELAELENSKLMNQMSLMGIMTAEEVATITYNKFMKGKRIIIPGIMNKVGVFANRLFSRKFMTKVIHKMQESR